MALGLGFFFGLVLFPTRYFPLSAKVALSLALSMLLSFDSATQVSSFIASEHVSTGLMWSLFTRNFGIGVLISLSMMFPIVAAMLVGRWMSTLAGRPARSADSKLAAVELAIILIVLGYAFGPDRLATVFGVIGESVPPLGQSEYLQGIGKLFGVAFLSSANFALPVIMISLSLDILLVFHSKVLSKGTVATFSAVRTPVVALVLTFLVQQLSMLFAMNSYWSPM